MTTALSTSSAAYRNVADPLAFVKLVGNAIARSQMFGCDNEEAGQVLALECLARQSPPMMLAERYHIIHGRLSMKSEAMIADFMAIKDHSMQLVERSPDRAAIILWVDGAEHPFQLTWDEAKQEPFVYEGKESAVVSQLADAGKAPKLKAKYATPRSRMQMLWNRLISDSVRVLAPQITAGAYTPDEIDDFTDEPQIGIVEVVDDSLVTNPEEPLTPAVIEHMPMNADPPATTAPPDMRTSMSVDEQCTPDMAAKAKQLIGELHQTDQTILPRIKKSLNAAGLAAIANMTVADCERLIACLERKEAEQFFDRELSKPTPTEDGNDRPPF